MICDVLTNCSITKPATFWRIFQSQSLPLLSANFKFTQLISEKIFYASVGEKGIKLRPWTWRAKSLEYLAIHRFSRSKAFLERLWKMLQNVARSKSFLKDLIAFKKFSLLASMQTFLFEDHAMEKLLFWRTTIKCLPWIIILINLSFSLRDSNPHFALN